MMCVGGMVVRERRRSHAHVAARALKAGAGQIPRVRLRAATHQLLETHVKCEQVKNQREC
jgi:hypothetical protein